MSKFEKIIEELEYSVSWRDAKVILGTKGLFGSTYSDAVQAQAELDTYREAIRILKEYDD